MKYIKICPCCGNTFETNVKHRQACKSCLANSNLKVVTQMLQTLEILGWSDLIDARWKNKVISNLKEFYDRRIPMIDIYKLLEIVLV